MDCASLNLIITLSSLFSRSRMVRLMGFSQRNPSLFSQTSFNLSCSVNNMLFLTLVSCFSLSRVILRQFQSLVERPILVELSAVLESTHLLFLPAMKSSLNPFNFLFSFFNFSISSLYFSLISSACLKKARRSSSSILFFWFWWSISESIVTAFRSMAERARIIVMLLNRNCNIIHRREAMYIQKSRILACLLQKIVLGLLFLYSTAHPTQLLVDQLRSRVQFRRDGGQFSYRHELGVLRLGDVGLQDKGILLLDLVDLMDGLFGGNEIYGRFHDYFLEFGLNIDGRRCFATLLYQK